MLEQATVKVRVFHNNETRRAPYIGYAPEHSVTEVLAVESAIGAGAVGAELARETFERLDGRELEVPATWVIAYFASGNRPLANGDVIAVVDADTTTTFYAVGDEVTAIDAPRIAPEWKPGTAWTDEDLARA